MFEPQSVFVSARTLDKHSAKVDFGDYYMVICIHTWDFVEVQSSRFHDKGVSHAICPKIAPVVPLAARHSTLCRCMIFAFSTSFQILRETVTLS